MSKDKNSPSEYDPVTDKDAIVARTQPAIMCDAFLAESSDEWFRITFGETTTDKRDNIRFAMVMPVGDVKELVRVLTALLDKLEPQEKSSKTKEAGS